MVSGAKRLVGELVTGLFAAALLAVGMPAGAAAFTAHGSVQPVEDAVVLAQALARTDDVEAALSAYTERRQERAKLVVHTSVEVMRGEQEHRPDHEWAAMRAQAFQKLAEPY
jgi:2-polyprenyl-6-methoxyphenol hydroxylase-like FAD-dependent oxidoreductase